MLYNAKNGVVKTDRGQMPYVSFGSGDEYLIMIPGLGDGLTNVKGFAVPFSIQYRVLCKDFKVFMFSRITELNDGDSTRLMAKDIVCAMKELGITKGNILGISMGGMIAQYIAIDYPDVVNKLILTVTLSRGNDISEKALGIWKQMFLDKNYKNLMIDMAKRIYTPSYFKKNILSYKLMGIFFKPKKNNTFIIQSNACLNHNSYPILSKIACPSLIIGGQVDNVLGIEASKEIHENIKNSTLYIYESYGHGAFEEAKDFLTRIISFLKQ